VRKWSIVIARRKTSVSCEEIFWTELRALAKARRCTLQDLVAAIDAGAAGGNLSSKLRVFVLRAALAQSAAAAADHDATAIGDPDDAGEPWSR
jgi:predicted DNA-binding ribbon-helix-helix protein